MLFGSAARGDIDEHSDIDVLVLRKGRAATTRSGRFNLSSYSASQLAAMASYGSLFVRHLAMDGIICEDPTGALQRALDHYQKPASYTHFKAELKATVPLFDVSEADFNRCSNRWLSTAIYCLRSYIYIRADEENVLHFSLRELARITEWEDVNLLLWSRRVQGVNVWVAFSEVVASLEENLGTSRENPYKTIEAYATNVFDAHPLVLGLTLRLLRGGNAPINYDLLSPFVWVSEQ